MYAMYDLVCLSVRFLCYESVRPQGQKERTGSSGKLNKVTVILWFGFSIQYVW